MTRCSPVGGPVGIDGRARATDRRVEPVGAPLPHVARRVVEPEPVRARRHPPVRCRRSRRPGSCGSGRCPATRCSGADRRVRARRPTGTGPARDLPAPRTPTPPRSAGARRPTRSTPSRRTTRRARPGGRSRPSIDDCGPSGWAQSAPNTCRHHGAWATPRVGSKSSGSKPPNTNDQPSVSAVVRWSVAATNWAKSWLVTATVSIENGAQPHLADGTLAVGREPVGILGAHEEAATGERHHRRPDRLRRSRRRPWRPWRAWRRLGRPRRRTGRDRRGPVGPGNPGWGAARVVDLGHGAFLAPDRPSRHATHRTGGP